MLPISETSWFRPLLTCPDCGNQLSGDVKLVCSQCDFSDETRKDLRMRIGRCVELRLPRLQLLDPGTVLLNIDTSRPAIVYGGLILSTFR